MTNQKLAEELYEIYCSAVGGKAFNGSPLPKWAEFRSDPGKQGQVRGWLAVAEKASDLESPESELESAAVED